MQRGPPNGGRSLERRGSVKSRQGKPTKVRGGRAKLYWRVTDRGKCAVTEALVTIDSLRGAAVLPIVSTNGITVLKNSEFMRGSITKGI